MLAGGKRGSRGAGALNGSRLGALGALFVRPQAVVLASPFTQFFFKLCAICAAGLACVRHDRAVLAHDSCIRVVFAVSYSGGVAIFAVALYGDTLWWHFGGIFAFKLAAQFMRFTERKTTELRLRVHCETPYIPIGVFFPL